MSPSTNAHRSMPTRVVQENKAQASRATPDLHISIKNAVKAVKNIVRKGSDLLSVSPGVNDPTSGSGIVVKTGRPVALNAKGDGENPNADIHHQGLSDAVVIGSRIDDNFVMTKSKVSIDCLS